MSRPELIAHRADPLREHRTRKRPATKRAGDDIGRVRQRHGIDWRKAIEIARALPWWPRVRSESPTPSAGYWCWPLRGEA